MHVLVIKLLGLTVKLDLFFSTLKTAQRKMFSEVSKITHYLKERSWMTCLFYLR